MSNEIRDMEQKDKSNSNSLGCTLMLIAGLGIIGGGLGVMNVATQNNANLTNKVARNLSSVVLGENKTLSREKTSKFLQTLGYQEKLAENQSVYFRPKVNGFWENEVQIVIAPNMNQDGARVREGNLLFDAYTRNPAGKVIASFTRDELVKKGYSTD